MEPSHGRSAWRRFAVPAVVSATDCLAIAIALSASVLVGFLAYAVTNSGPAAILAAGQGFLSVFHFLDRLIMAGVEADSSKSRRQ
jgi:hypothetical protein